MSEHMKTRRTKFQIQGEFIELAKLLKVTGLCGTGGMAKIVIIEELVTVDGKVETRKRCKLRPGQVVGFEGQEVEVE